MLTTVPGPFADRPYREATPSTGNGEVIETSGHHVNLTWTMREVDNDTMSIRYERNADGTRRLDENGIAVGTLVIKDPTKYMEELDRRSREKYGRNMNARTRDMIRTYVVANKDRELDTRDGAPGTHAEILAINELFDKSPDLDVADVTLATVKLHPEHATGLPRVRELLWHLGRRRDHHRSRWRCPCIRLVAPLPRHELGLTDP